MEKLELVHSWWECTTDCVAAVKNNMVMFATTWMYLAIVILSEVSQTKKDKYRMISFFSPFGCAGSTLLQGLSFFWLQQVGYGGFSLWGLLVSEHGL